MLVVGAGALGCAAAETLAGCAAVRVTVVDHDVVELSNLQRQVLFDEADISRPKAAAAVERLHSAAAEFCALDLRVDATNVDRLVAEHDAVLDATDDPDTKFLLNRAAVTAGTPYCYAGVIRSSGQWMLVDPERSACLACAFPEQAGERDRDDGCAVLGILAPVAGIVGTMAAVEVLRQLFEPEMAEPGRLNVYELEGRRWRNLNFSKLASCQCCGTTAPRADERENEPDRRPESCLS